MILLDISSVIFYIGAFALVAVAVYLREKSTKAIEARQFAKWKAENRAKILQEPKISDEPCIFRLKGATEEQINCLMENFLGEETHSQNDGGVFSLKVNDNLGILEAVDMVYDYLLQITDGTTKADWGNSQPDIKVLIPTDEITIDGQTFRNTQVILQCLIGDVEIALTTQEGYTFTVYDSKEDSLILIPAKDN